MADHFSISLQDSRIVDLGFTGADRYDLIRIFRDGGPTSDRDATLLGEFNRRDAVIQKWYMEDKIANTKRHLMLLLVVAVASIALIFLLPNLLLT